MHTAIHLEVRTYYQVQRAYMKHSTLNKNHVRAGYSRQTCYLAHLLSSDQLQSFQEAGTDQVDVSVAGGWRLSNVDGISMTGIDVLL